MTSKRKPAEPDEDEVNRPVIALTLGVSEREITNLVKAHPDFPSIVRGKARTFPRRRCVQWFVRFKAQEAVKRAKPATPSNVEESRRRREEAEMRLVEMDLADREARTVSADHVDRVVGEVCDRLRAAVVNMPGNYGIRLEELGVEPAKAEAVLTTIAEDLTRSLRVVADDLDALEDDASASGDDAGAAHVDGESTATD